jgi:PhnB protein
MAESGSTLMPYLVIDGAADAIEFYRRAFGAEEVMRMPTPDGSRIVHATLRIRGNLLFVSDPLGMGKDPKELGGSPVTLHLQVPDADGLFAQAVAAGATETMAVEEMFWGDRYGTLIDPFGHHWSIATTVREPSREEMETAVKQYFG